ncbi:hypothetical protein CQA18_26090, partial [Enterobacter hormaechei]
FSRYLIRHLFLGFAAAAGLLLPLFTTFNLINELDDVSPGGYRWTQATSLCCRNFPDECFQSLFNPSSLSRFCRRRRAIAAAFYHLQPD